MTPILLTAAGNPENQDRGLMLCQGSTVLVCVADGAGGQSGGLQAANMAIELLRQKASAAATPEACSEILRQMDAAICDDPVAGETTCAFAVMTTQEVFGASVGESGIWFIPENAAHIDLTRGQQRRPFVGCGSASPVPFRLDIRKGLLLLATDGLLKYTSAERILETCRQNPPKLAVERLIELVRYPSGALPDDVTVILT